MASIKQLESMLLFEQDHIMIAEESLNKCKEHLFECSEDNDVENWFNRYMEIKGYVLNFKSRVTELRKIIDELKEKES